MPKSSTANDTPLASSRPTVDTIASVCASSSSMISSVSASAGTAKSCSRAKTSSANDGSRSRSADTLVVTRGPSGPQAAASCRARCSTQVVIGPDRDDSLTTGRKSSGSSRPRSGWRQRSKASIESSVPSMRTTGW